jgi:hypothetical protein
MEMIQTLYIFLCGFLFAFLQFSYFFILESNVSSSGLTYLTTTCAWIFGAILGLFIEKKQPPLIEHTMLFLAIAAFYIVLLLIGRNPFDLSWFWAYMILITASGVYAGYFFNANREQYRAIKNLFFWENNGFMMGLLTSFLGFTLLGKKFHFSFPIIFFVLILTLQIIIAKGKNRQRKDLISY